MLSKSKKETLRKNDHVDVNGPLDSIDVVKFIGSVLIFAMHCSALADYPVASIVLEIMARWGVPFFFICSSFLLFRKGAGRTIEKTYLHRFVFRIARLYLGWLVINLPSVFISRLLSKDLTDIGTWIEFGKNSLLSSTFTGS